MTPRGSAARLGGEVAFWGPFLATLHVCLDEAGNLKFAPSGSRYYVFAVAWTYDPGPLARELTDLRFALLKSGHDLDAFHASEDLQVNRDAVVKVLTKTLGWHFVAIVVDKRKVNPSLYEEKIFYPKFAGMALRFVFKGCVARGTTKVVAFTDQLPIKKHRDAVEKTFKTTCRGDLPANTPFEIYHHSRQSNCWLQVVDYCCWSVFRQWGGGDVRTYDVLRPRLYKPELDVFRMGDGTEYY
jgi:hypothetical protein